MDVDSEQPILLGGMVVLDSAGVPTLRVMTDSAGRFRIPVPTPDARFYLYAHAPAYRSYMDGPFRVGKGDTLRIDYRVQALPYSLDPILVTVEERQRRLTLSGFYTRQSTEPGGVFLGPSEIAQKAAVWGTDLFRGIPGVHVVPDQRGLGGVRVILRNRCLPRLFLDGVRVRGSIDDLVSPGAVQGVEVYRSPAQAPLQYGGTGARCGVIVIWTY